MLQRLNSTANFFTTMEISERNLLGKSVYLALFFGVRFANLSPMKIKIRFPFRLRLSKY